MLHVAYARTIDHPKILVIVYAIFTITIIALLSLYLFFFFNDTATTEIYTLSLHDALPIFTSCSVTMMLFLHLEVKSVGSAGMPRSEERFSRNAETDLVCRLLLEKKKNKI